MTTYGPLPLAVKSADSGECRSPIPRWRSPWSERVAAEVLRLKYELGRSHREIAAAIGIAISTVSKYASQAEEGGLSWPWLVCSDWQSMPIWSERIVPRSMALWLVVLHSLDRRAGEGSEGQGEPPRADLPGSLHALALELVPKILGASRPSSRERGSLVRDVSTRASVDPRIRLHEQRDRNQPYRDFAETAGDGVCHSHDLRCPAALGHEDSRLRASLAFVRSQGVRHGCAVSDGFAEGYGVDDRLRGALAGVRQHRMCG